MTASNSNPGTNPGSTFDDDLFTSAFISMEDPNATIAMTDIVPSETQVVVKPPKKQKPARKQVKPGEFERKEAPQTGKEYNIWYNKWAGGDMEDNYSNKVKALTRCHVRKDSGWTRADTMGVKYCCLHFARGSCPKGYECNFLHVLPLPDKELPETSKDCFGRDKFSDYREDMGGVGSFSKQNRTIYIGRIKETGPGHETEEIVRRHFSEWGVIEKMRVLQGRSVAFVTYERELTAQFAREAMACQSLDNDEILNVRWATGDPNPTAQVAEKHRLEEVGQQAIANKIDPRTIDAMRHIRALEDEEDVPQAPEDEERQAKRQRIGNYDPEDEPEDVSPPPEALPAASGLLSADTLEGMKYFAQIRQRREEALKAAPPAKKTGLGALGAYASDSD